MRDPAAVRSALKALSGGERVDWDALASDVSGELSRSVVQQLQVIAQIADAHAAPPAPFARVLPFRLAPGTLWGTLRLRSLVGSGADGDVYCAFDDRLQREVALKLLRRSPDERRLAHALEEARLHARVRHPNIVTVYGADVVEGVAGVWMELIPGDTLQSLVASRGPFSAEDASIIGAEICRGLAAIHQAGVIHRDIKAQNVMREQNGRVVVMDFSVSRNDDAERPGLAGTPLYLAPELFAGAPASVSSDVYSVGVLLYYLVTGQYPASASTIADVARIHAERRSVGLRDVRADLPSGFNSTVDRALLADPAARFASASEFEAALLGGPRVTGGRRRFWAAAILALLVAGAVWQWTPKASQPTVTSAPQARRWVLVASFENRTDDSALDGVLDYALERELGSSQQFRVASRPRVDDVLKLMRRPIEQRLDRETAREVALRDGNITTVIDGRVERVGTTIVLSASAIDAATGATLITLSEEAAGGAALQSSIRRVSNRLREALGETVGAIRVSEQQLEQVTTPSLTALRLYSESWAAGERDHWPAALTLAREAVQADPQFAAAHTWLAWALMRNGTDREEYLAAASRGEALSSNASDWERLWIRASHLGLHGRGDEALAEYEALVRIRPDHFWAVNNLFTLHRRNGSDANALTTLKRLLELRPNHYNSLYLAFDTARRLRKLDEAAEYADRIKATGTYNRGPSGDAWVFDAVVAWKNGDARAFSQELRKIQDEALSYDQELRDAVLARTSMLWLAAGRPIDAADTLRPVADIADARLARAVIAHATADLATAKRETLGAQILSVPEGGTNFGEATQSALVVWLAARSSSSRETRTVYSALLPRAEHTIPPQGPANVNVLAAELAFAEGKVGEVVTRLAPQDGWNKLRDATNFRAAETLAEALVRTGDSAGAVKALERATASGHLGSTDAPYWQMRIQLRLAELYQSLGRRDEGIKLAGVLAHQLSEAEPGFPMAARTRAVLADAAASSAAAPAPVTTRSIRARRLYLSAAQMLQGAPPWLNADAERLLREAIQFDPEFASAHIVLAHALSNQRHRPEVYLAEASKARNTSSGASEAEREFIEGSYFQLLSQSQAAVRDWRRALEQSAAHYERVLVLDPNHPWAAGNLTNVYIALRRSPDVLRLRIAEAERNPDNAIAQNWPAIELYAAGEFDRAAPYIAKSRLLIERVRDPENRYHATWLSLADAHRLWLTDLPQEALHVVNAAKPHATQPNVMEVFRLQVMAAYLTLGRLNQAERIAASAPTPAERSDLMMEVLASRDDRSRMQALLNANYLTAEDAARVAWLPLPFEVLATQLRRLQNARPTDPAFVATSSLVDGRLALADGQVDKAITLLQPAFARRPERGIGRLMSVAMLLADAFVAKHDIASAIDAIETATQPRSMTSFGASTGATWLSARAKLADLYRRAGRATDAERIEEHLRKLLVVADEDHPLKLKLAPRRAITDSQQNGR